MFQYYGKSCWLRVGRRNRGCPSSIVVHLLRAMRSLIPVVCYLSALGRLNYLFQPLGSYTILHPGYTALTGNQWNFPIVFGAMSMTPFQDQYSTFLRISVSPVLLCVSLDWLLIVTCLNRVVHSTWIISRTTILPAGSSKPRRGYSVQSAA